MTQVPSWTRPRFSELPVTPGAPPASVWGLYGPDDELGTLNLLTPERVVAASVCIRTGKRFSLSLPLDEPSPPMFGRQPLRHEVFHLGPQVLDDRLDNFYPQGSTQWDAVSHCADSHGFYNGRSEDDVIGKGQLGIDAVADKGIVGRGVLLDVARAEQANGRPVDARSALAITPDVLAATARGEGVELREGDILCVRTGWMAWYLGCDDDERARLAERSLTFSEFSCPGLSCGTDMAEFLWDRGIAAVAVDNPTCEAMPPPPEAAGTAEGSAFDRTLHVWVKSLLGMTLGELFDFEALAQDCAQDGIYEFFLTSAPLKIPGGIGTPPNALAIK